MFNTILKWNKKFENWKVYKKSLVADVAFHAMATVEYQDLIKHAADYCSLQQLCPNSHKTTTVILVESAIGDAMSTLEEMNSPLITSGNSAETIARLSFVKKGLEDLIPSLNSYLNQITTTGRLKRSTGKTRIYFYLFRF